MKIECIIKLKGSKIWENKRIKAGIWENKKDKAGIWENKTDKSRTMRK